MFHRFFFSLALILFSETAVATLYPGETLGGSLAQFRGPTDLWLYDGTTRMDLIPFEVHRTSEPEAEVSVSSILGKMDTVIVVFTEPIHRPFNWQPDRTTLTAARAIGGATILFVDGKRTDRLSRGQPIRTLPPGLWIELQPNARLREKIQDSLHRVDIPSTPCTLNVQDRLRHAGIRFISGATLLPSIVLGKILMKELREYQWLGAKETPFKVHLVNTSTGKPREFFTSLFLRDSNMAHARGVPQFLLPFMSDALSKRRRFFISQRLKLNFATNVCSAFLSGLMDRWPTFSEGKNAKEPRQ
jgi:hypothetical protein